MTKLERTLLSLSTWKFHHYKCSLGVLTKLKFLFLNFCFIKMINYNIIITQIVATHIFHLWISFLYDPIDIFWHLNKTWRCTRRTILPNTTERYNAGQYFTAILCDHQTGTLCTTAYIEFVIGCTKEMTHNSVQMWIYIFACIVRQYSLLAEFECCRNWTVVCFIAECGNFANLSFGGNYFVLHRQWYWCNHLWKYIQ